MLNEHKNHQIKSHVSLYHLHIYFLPVSQIYHHYPSLIIRKYWKCTYSSTNFPSKFSIQIFHPYFPSSSRSSRSEAKALAFFGAPARGVHGTQAVEGSSHLVSNGEKKRDRAAKWCDFLVVYRYLW